MNYIPTLFEKDVYRKKTPSPFRRDQCDIMPLFVLLISVHWLLSLIPSFLAGSLYKSADVYRLLFSSYIISSFFSANPTFMYPGIRQAQTGDLIPNGPH